MAKQVPHVWHRVTGDVDDPWKWLADRSDPDVIAYLEAENAYTHAWLDKHHDTVEAVFGEIKSRIQETDESPPVERDGWWYASRTAEGASYPIHCRGRSAATATSEVILDENREAAGHGYFALSAFDLNHSQHLLAWSSDTDGSEHYTLRIRDLSTMAELDDTIEDTTWAGTAWSADDHWLFYVTDDDAQRPYRVWRHRLGTAQRDDVLVYEENDERFNVGVDLSRSAAWILIDSHSKTSSECRVVPVDQPTNDPVVVRPRADNVEYSVDHWGDRFVVLTNLTEPDFSVMTAPLDRPGEWTEFIAGEAGRRITAAEPFDGFLVVHEWVAAQPGLRIVRPDGASSPVDVDDQPHDVELDVNPMYRTSRLRIATQSYSRPARVLEHDIVTGQQTLLKEIPVLGVDLSRYTSERTWATAQDGTQVPVDVVGLAGDTTARPTVVYAYGSYEVSLAPWFSVARLSLIDRGVRFAVAHPRGGGEMGRQWYLDGKLLSKRNTFTDTISACEHLVERGLADPDRIALRGGSAGGLLVGACVTMRPELFRAAVAEVPFVDVVNTMSDPSMPLTVTEWDEWGDPRDEPFASYIGAYSPYDNTAPGEYPTMLVTAGLNDPRVSYHEPAKWVAKLRALRTDTNVLLMRTEMGAGHGGPSGRYDAWRDEAEILAFLLTSLLPTSVLPASVLPASLE